MSEIERKRRQVHKQGLNSAKKGTLFPRELQNVPGDRWEDAKVYSKQTRQGQNHWQDHLKRSTERGRRVTKQSEKNFGENAEAKRRYQRRVLESAFNKK